MVRFPVRRILVFCLVSICLSSCGPSDDEVSEYVPPEVLETSPDSLSEPVTSENAGFMRASHIFIALGPSSDSTEVSEDEALASIRIIQGDILSGRATFEEMAFNYSNCTSAADSGRLPAFTTGAVTEELDSTVSALEPGEMSGIVRTRFGYHIVKRLDS